MYETNTMRKTTVIKTHFGRVKAKLNDFSYRVKATMYAASAAILMTYVPMNCADFDDVVTSLVGFIYDLARVVGIVLAINGAFNWLLANKDENADGQSRGIKLVVVGLALVFLESLAAPILKAAGF